jgi:hypothetical protein
MIRVSAVSEFEQFELEDKNGGVRKLKLYEKKGNIYIGPIQVLFNRAFICKDKNRMDFVSKLDKRFNELMHITVIFKKIDQHKLYSNFTKEALKEFLYSKGYTDEDLTFKDKTYTCAKENFIEYGFNSMNFCLDRRDDIWVHYKEYEEHKQYKEIVNHIPKEIRRDFESEYCKMIRFIRYVNIDDVNDIKCFALKSINITKLYNWLSDNHIIHKINYVADIYNETLRVLDFTDITVDNTFVKVIATQDGVILKQPATELI